MAHSLLSRAVETGHIGFGMADAGGSITYANRRLAEILGRPDAVGLRLDELGLGADATSRLEPGPDERLIRRPDGRRAWTLIERSELTNESATANAYMFTLSDIDALKRTQADALSGSARLADFEQFAGVGVCRIDVDREIIVEVNDAMSAIYGYAPGELLGADPRVLAGLDRPENAPLGYLTAVVQDVTEQHAESERIRHQALHDSLTGLANRTRFAQLVADAAARPESQRGHVAVLFLDLDQFKIVNDALGHMAGDELLRAVAQRFDDAACEAEIVIRFGGDEFVVFCTGIYRVEDAEEVARRLLNSLQMPFTVGGRYVFVTASVGISLSAETLLARSSRDLQLAAQLHEALAEEQFVLDYQPIVELESGRVAGLEALIRWQHPTEGRLPPSEFVPIAERTGMIVPLGEWILRRACADARVWQETHPDVTVRVNVSPSQLVDTLPDEMGAALQASGLEPERLVVEVTEAAMVPDPADIDVPGALRSLGVTIALDDFGTGYSCLAFLDRLPLDELKIDRQFVDRLGKSDAGATVLSTILRLAQAFGLRAVAEGIETEAQLQALRDLGCKFGQGFHFSPPIPTDRVGGLLTGPSLR